MPKDIERLHLGEGGDVESVVIDNDIEQAVSLFT